MRLHTSREPRRGLRPPAPADDVHLLAGEADVVDARQMFFFRTSAMTSAYLTPPIELIR